MNSQNRSEFNKELKNQLSIIKNSIEVIRDRAKYGTFEKFAEHLTRIEKAATTIADQMDGNFLSSQKKYNKILVPFDGSTYSKKALDEAIEISKRFNSVLQLVTIVDISTVNPPGMLFGLMRDKKMKKLTKEFLNSIKLKIQSMLKSYVDMCKKQGIEADYEVIIGNVVDSILKFANSQKIDLIVIGSKGLSGVHKLMALGSVSRKVSEEASCPVLIVR